VSHRQALRHLRRADPVMARVISRVGPCRFGPRNDHTHFYHLCRAIVYQQLSTGAATTIHGRFVALFPTSPPRPADVAAAADAPLRAAGLSRQKAAYIRDLASKVHDGSLPLDRIAAMPDEEVIAALTQVKGIGKWSAQMFLMFRLGRPDVLPDLDLGIQKAVKLAYGLRSHPSPTRVLKIGKPWSPYATVASWYLWRSLD
jgi:DNA-3-methyladenine glycosylase II